MCTVTGISIGIPIRNWMRNERVDDLMESYGKIRSRLTWRGRIMRVVLLRTRRRFRQWLRLLPAYYRRRQALLWQRLYHARYRVQVQFKRHSAIAAVILVILVIGVIPFWLPAFQDNLEPFFDTDQKVQALRSLFLAVGAALLGAVTIISSFVLFSMQVNIERIPHGLFRRLSTDLPARRHYLEGSLNS